MYKKLDEYVKDHDADIAVAVRKESERLTHQFGKQDSSAQEKELPTEQDISKTVSNQNMSVSQRVRHLQICWKPMT